MKPPDDFFVRFESEYGHGSVREFNRIVMDTHKSLADAARRFGFSREYARRVFQKIHGYPYSRLLAYKKRIRDEEVALKRIKQLKTGHAG